MRLVVCTAESCCRPMRATGLNRRSNTLSTTGLPMIPPSTCYMWSNRSCFMDPSPKRQCTIDSRRSDTGAIDNGHYTGRRRWYFTRMGFVAGRCLCLVIVSYADEHDTDSRAMGTHGRMGVERYLLGSVAEKVVRLTETPVLTVRLADSDDRS